MGEMDRNERNALREALPSRIGRASGPTLQVHFLASWARHLPSGLKRPLRSRCNF